MRMRWMYGMKQLGGREKKGYIQVKRNVILKSK